MRVIVDRARLAATSAAPRGPDCAVRQSISWVGILLRLWYSRCGIAERAVSRVEVGKARQSSVQLARVRIAKAIEGSRLRRSVGIICTAARKRMRKNLHGFGEGCVE
jgi:hypothetical protein